jgi:hypothetical protein
MMLGALAMVRKCTHSKSKSLSETDASFSKQNEYSPICYLADTGTSLRLPTLLAVKM